MLTHPAACLSVAQFEEHAHQVRRLIQPVAKAIPIQAFSSGHGVVCHNRQTARSRVQHRERFLRWPNTNVRCAVQRSQLLHRHKRMRYTPDAFLNLLQLGPMPDKQTAEGLPVLPKAGNRTSEEHWVLILAEPSRV